MKIIEPIFKNSSLTLLRVLFESLSENYPLFPKNTNTSIEEVSKKTKSSTDKTGQKWTKQDTQKLIIPKTPRILAHRKLRE